VIGWNHGGVGEILTTCYPQGSIETNQTQTLLEKTQHLLTQPAQLSVQTLFRLEDMCAQTLALYAQLQQN
jgi:hypothetical protein